LRVEPEGFLIRIVLAMTNGPDLPTPELPAQALGWLDLLAQLMPETVKFEVSSYVLIVALVALWIWRHPPRGGGRQKE
jgi:hypothetical protein